MWGEPHVHMSAGTHEGQKRAIDALELELQVVAKHPYLGGLQKQFLILSVRSPLLRLRCNLEFSLWDRQTRKSHVMVHDVTY